MLTGTYHKVVEIRNHETQLKIHLKKTREALKKKIAVDVFDAFENSIVKFWLGKDAGAEPQERQYLYFPKLKSLHPYDEGEFNLSPFSFSFKLKQNCKILDDYLWAYVKDDGPTSVAPAMKKFWEKGVDEIFCKYQFIFEEDLDRALEKQLEAFLDEVLKHVPTN